MKKKFNPAGLVADDASAVRSIYVSAFVCLAIFIAAIPLPRIDGLLVGGDGIRYYSVLRSIFFDFDLSFANDYRLMGAKSGPDTVTGLQPCDFAIGTPLLWLPFMAAAHLIAILLDWVGVAVPLDGTGYLHQAFVCCGSIVYAGVGFALVFKVCRRLFSVRSALIGVMVLWWASPGVYYATAEPSMSHAASIFAGAIFLYVWHPPSSERGIGDWIKIGLAVGLAALVRWQDGMLVVLPMAELIYRLAKKQLSAVQAFTRGLLMGIAVLVAFSPQFLMWTIVYGSPIVIPQVAISTREYDFFNWASPHPLLTLFSARHGLISWHPVFLFALAGLINLWKRDRVLSMAVVFAFLVQLYINSSAHRWWGADSFGGRRFVSLLPLLTLPLTALLEDIERGAARKAVMVVFAALIIWNGLSFAQYRLGFISKNEALSLKEMTLNRLLIPFKIMDRRYIFPSYDRH